MAGKKFMLPEKLEPKRGERKEAKMPPKARAAMEQAEMAGSAPPGFKRGGKVVKKGC